MNFWANNSAAPTWLHTWEREPRAGYLRTVPATKPTVAGYEPIRATSNYVNELTQFWTRFYRGQDWCMEIAERHVKSYLDDQQVYVYVLLKKGRIVASIVSSPCPLSMSNGATCPTARIIEGLVVHPLLRKNGIAGLLIAYIDFITSKDGPVCHLWAREEMAPSLFSTAISKLPYSYILPENIIRSSMSVETIPWADFLQLKLEKQTQGPWIRSTVAQTRRDDLDVWYGVNTYVVVTTTRRIETKSYRPIYEIIWCSDSPPQGLLESIALHYDGPVFTTLSPRFLSPEWITGRSGYHCWYIYNYLPPAFGNCSVELIREEL